MQAWPQINVVLHGCLHVLIHLLLSVRAAHKIWIVWPHGPSISIVSSHLISSHRTEQIDLQAWPHFISFWHGQLHCNESWPHNVLIECPHAGTIFSTDALHGPQSESKWQYCMHRWLQLLFTFWQNSRHIDLSSDSCSLLMMWHLLLQRWPHIMRTPHALAHHAVVLHFRSTHCVIWWFEHTISSRLPMALVCFRCPTIFDQNWLFCAKSVNFPMQNNPILARVSATFTRFCSLKNPMSSSLLLRTNDIKTMSACWPWKLSTVDTFTLRSSSFWSIVLFK